MATGTGNNNQRQKQRESTRRQILQAAARVFARHGFEAASMAEIAAEAQLKKALVQYHFETKENLWKAAVEQLWQQRDRLLPRYFGGEADMQGDNSLHDLFTALITFTRDHPEWMALVFRESANPGPRLDWLIDNFLGSDLSRGTRFIEQAQGARYVSGKTSRSTACLGRS